MVERSKKNKDHQQFVPLHRPKGFDHERRKLLKYTSQGLWYGDEKLGDSVKNDWKKWIKRKGWNKNKGSVNKNKNNSNLPITTVCFVPKTKDAKLIEGVQEVENQLGPRIGWKT